MNRLFFLVGVFAIGLLIPSCKKHQFDEPTLLVPGTVIEDESLPSVFVNDTHLHSEAFGDPQDPMLVVVHGGPGGDYRSLLNFKDLVNNGLYVVFYDQLGSGLSERYDKAYYQNKKVQFFIDDLAAIIEHYTHSDTQKIILAGHSWGAMLATAYVNQNPNKVDGIILTEPGGFKWSDTEAYIKRSFKLNLFGETSNDAVYTDQFITGNDHETLDYKYILFFSNSDTGDQAIPPYWRPGAVISKWAQSYAQNHQEEMDFTANLHLYTNKVLFAYSENNQHYGIDHARKVSAAYPNVKLIEVNDCGHEIVHFGWAQFYPTVLTYLNEIL